MNDDIEIMIQYMQMKIRQRDWHGVSDAANDIREMEAKKKPKYPMQVSIKDFVSMVKGKEKLEGRPIYFAQFPNDDNR
jgi:hypothetical protein